MCVEGYLEVVCSCCVLVGGVVWHVAEVISEGIGAPTEEEFNYGVRDSVGVE